MRGLACHPPYGERGALLPHLFTLTRRLTGPKPGSLGAVYFLCHFPSGRPDRGLPGALPCGVRTFLPTQRRNATRGGRLSLYDGLSKIRFPGEAPVWTALLRRSQPAWLLPPRALPDGRLARKPPVRGGDGGAASGSARRAAPSLRLARRAPRQETTRVRRTTLLRRAQPAGLLPPRAWPDERLARKPPVRGGDGGAASGTARRAAPSLRLARRAPRQETTRVRRTTLLRRAQPAGLLPPRAWPDERLARKPPVRGGDGGAASGTARRAAPSSRLARRTPRQETTRRPGSCSRLGFRLLQSPRVSRRSPGESDTAPASCTGYFGACRSPRPSSRCSSRTPGASRRGTPARQSP